MKRKKRLHRSSLHFEYIHSEVQVMRQKLQTTIDKITKMEDTYNAFSDIGDDYYSMIN